MEKTLILSAAIAAALSLASCGSDSSSSSAGERQPDSSTDLTPEQIDSAEIATQRIIDIYTNAIKSIRRAETVQQIEDIDRGLSIDMENIPAGTAFNASQRARVKEVEAEYFDVRLARDNKLKYGQEQPDESIPADEFMSRED